MRIGITGDLHEPFTHPGYRRFSEDTFDAHKVQQTVFIGDIVDNHAISFHDHDPNGRSAEDEAAAAERAVAKWYTTFTKAKVCIGNHDARHFRLAQKNGLPERPSRSPTRR